MEEKELKIEETEKDYTSWYGHLLCFFFGWLFGRVGVGTIIAIVDMGSRTIRDLIDWGIL